MRLFCTNGRADSLTVEGRVVSPAQGIDECLRITVGTPDENDRLLAVLRESVTKEQQRA